jgi:hypothetical protein
MKKEMVFEVNVNLAESYLYGVAKGINGCQKNCYILRGIRM